jgi:hypothetical protein
MAPAFLALLLLAPPTAPVPAPVPAPDPARLLARLTAGEPPVAAVQEAAARHAESATPDPAELARRRRLSALLPRLTAEVRLAQSDYRVAGLQGTGEVDYLRSSPGRSVALHATWELGDLIAATGEAAAAAAALARAARRDEAVRKATALHFERRRRLLALLADPPPDARARLEAELELARATAELDALTGGLLAGSRP